MTLSESLERYEAQASTSTPRDVAVRRAYMAGALAEQREIEAGMSQSIAAAGVAPKGRRGRKTAASVE